MYGRILSVFSAIIIAGCVSNHRVDSWPSPNGKATSLKAEYRPLEGEDPRPAVILLHGCGSWYGDRLGVWGEWFRERGYHALAVDSFESRGYTDGICRDLGRVPYFNRVSDAYGAL
ncbi:hypothetical protein KAJ83_05820 [Marivibrio halodurans]|uniref:Alpha/beta hydrolase n=1 Tax=Marivibrio halodurans TaxID=2039722 RepID=A0A8J7V1N0_9PROT|nr:hypothetical protein [Marivibrio halodurans]MBP5856515.1 hypothetical protein [Marivibrio halodurans]